MATTLQGGPSQSIFPLVAVPFVTEISSGSARLGASIISRRGRVQVKSGGTIFQSASGVKNTDNPLNATADQYGTFSHYRYLNPETHYYFKGFATSSLGTGSSSELDFYTWSNPTINSASVAYATPYSNQGIDVSFYTASFPATGATDKRYLILMSQDPYPALFNSTGSNGKPPTAGANTTIVGDTQHRSNGQFGPGYNSAFVSGLSAGATYNFAVMPYTWNGVNYETANYYTQSMATVTGTTSMVNPPVLINPICTQTTTSSVTIGATLTDAGEGGGYIDARGTAINKYSTLDISDYPVQEGQTDLGSYTMVRSALQSTPLEPQTLYYFAGYASNSQGGFAFSPQSSVYTLSNTPTSAVSSLIATPFNSTQIDLTFNSAAFPSTGATYKGYVVLYALSPSTPLLGNSDAQAPAAGQYTNLYNSFVTGSSTNISVTGLTQGVSYNFSIVPYCWNGTSYQTANYYTQDIPVANAMPGIVYPFNSIAIGNQIWMAQDLDITSYYDNTQIINIYDYDGSIDAYVLQLYENNQYDTNLSTYWIWREFDPQSKGYSKWYGPDVVNKLAVDPFPGWRVPTIADWEQLISNLGGSSVAGGKLKGPDTANLWNQTGYTYISYTTPFNAVPSGVSSIEEGTSYFIEEASWDTNFTLGFLRATYMAAYWTSETDKSFYYINHNSNSITRTTVPSYTPIVSSGFDAVMSIRLIRDV